MTQYVSSMHLTAIGSFEKAILYHKLSGVRIEASSDLFELIEYFNKPTTLSQFEHEFEVEGLEQIINALIDNSFLIPFGLNEETRWMDRMLVPQSVKSLQTKQFKVYYSDCTIYQLDKLLKVFGEQYKTIKQRGLSAPIKKKVILICNFETSLNQIFGLKNIPTSVHTFVLARSIIVINSKALHENLVNSHCFTQKIAHELVHVFLGETSCNIPIWLEEGICEYFSKYKCNKISKDPKLKFDLSCFDLVEDFSAFSFYELNSDTEVVTNYYRVAYDFVSYLISLKGTKLFLNGIFSTDLTRNFTSQCQKLFGASLTEILDNWLLENENQ